MSALQHPSQIIKSQDTIIKVGSLGAGKRVEIAGSVSDAGVLTLPTTNVPSNMYFLGGVTNASIAYNDGEQEYYVLGGGGFADSVKTTRRINASITSYLQRDFDSALQSDALSESMEAITKSRQFQDHEVYVQIFKNLGGLVFDTVLFCATVSNYQESYPADNLVEVTFDLASRGEIAIGKFTATSTTDPRPTDQGDDHET